MATIFYESSNELATLTNVFKVDGVATDPAAVSLVITTPSGVSTTYAYSGGEVDRTAEGTYRKDVTCSEAGEWQYRWEGTGSASDSESGTWTVWATTLGRLYATVAALKSRVGLQPDDTRDDAELNGACFAASRSIENYCERTFWRSAPATVRVFEPAGDGELVFGPWCDLVTLTGLAVDDAGAGAWSTSWSAADYQLLPLNPTAGPETRPYTKLRAVGSRRFPPLTGYGRTDRIQITGTWGWPAIPYAIREATLVVAAEIFKGKDAPLGVVGFGDYGAVRVRENPMAARLAGPYQLRPAGVA